MARLSIVRGASLTISKLQNKLINSIRFRHILSYRKIIKIFKRIDEVRSFSRLVACLVELIKHVYLIRVSNKNVSCVDAIGVVSLRDCNRRIRFVLYGSVVGR